MKTLADAGEFGLLEELGLFNLSAGAGWVGPGDDCAVIPRQKGSLAVTTDLLIEDVHFRLSTTGARELGWKAAAVNLSDLASMGARPLALTVGAALPPSLPLRWAVEFYEGLRECADSFGCALAGGDTSGAQKIALSVTALGDMENRRPALRSGASVGEDLWLSGFCGESAAGLLVLEKALNRSEAAEKMARRHLRPTPRVELGMELAAGELVSAMIDVSDGVLADAGHIAERSGVKIVVKSDKIPLSCELSACSGELGEDPLRLALCGGEDYELLFCAPPSNAGDIAAVGKKLGLGLSIIGKVEKGSGISLLDREGREVEVRKKGFSHF